MVYKDLNKRRANKREYYKKNKEKIKLWNKRWRKENRDKIKIQRKRADSKPLRKMRRNIRILTNLKYGKLKKGYQYHHWEPYNKDNFIILESKFHKWYHQHPKECCLKGRT